MSGKEFAKYLRLYKNIADIRKVYYNGYTMCKKNGEDMEIKDKMKYLEDVPLTFFSFLDGKKVYAISDNLIWYESGYGISTNSNLSKLLDNDYDSFFKYLKEKYPNNSIVKRSIKFFYCKDCPKLMRFIK